MDIPEDILERAKRIRSEASSDLASSSIPSLAPSLDPLPREERGDDFLAAALAIADRGSSTGASLSEAALPRHDDAIERAIALAAASPAAGQEDRLEAAALFASTTPIRLPTITPSDGAPATPPVLVFRGPDGRLRVSGGPQSSTSGSRPPEPPDSLPPRAAAARSRSRPPPITDREAAAMEPILGAADVAAADDAAVKELEVARLLAIMSDELLARAVDMPETEVAAIARARALSPDETRLRIVGANFRLSSVAQLRTARYGVQRFLEFTSSLGLESPTLDFSVGLMSTFLTGQTAKSMPARLLAGLRWAQDHMGGVLNAKSPFLDPFTKRFHGGGHARTWPPAVIARLERAASGRYRSAMPNERVADYVEAGAGALCLLSQGSLRWDDSRKSKLVAVKTDAVDGYAARTKTGPMHWWAELEPLSEGCDGYLDGLTKSLGAEPALPEDYCGIFRAATFTSKSTSGNPREVTGWARKAAAPKTHVLRLYRFILEIDVPDDAAIPEWLIKLALRLHGARRVYPTAARFLSGELGLTVDDRDELGRWAPSADRTDGRSRPMSNVYSTDAARHRCVETRSRVASAMRERLRRLIAAGDLTAETTWDFLVERMAPSITSIEPDVDAEERADDSDVEV
jgi:hypothetical protein